MVVAFDFSSASGCEVLGGDKQRSLQRNTFPAPTESGGLPEKISWWPTRLKETTYRPFCPLIPKS